MIDPRTRAHSSSCFSDFFFASFIGCRINVANETTQETARMKLASLNWAWSTTNLLRTKSVFVEKEKEKEHRRQFTALLFLFLLHDHCFVREHRDRWWGLNHLSPGPHRFLLRNFLRVRQVLHTMRGSFSDFEWWYRKCKQPSFRLEEPPSSTRLLPPGIAPRKLRIHQISPCSSLTWPRAPLSLLLCSLFHSFLLESSKFCAVKQYCDQGTSSRI